MASKYHHLIWVFGCEQIGSPTICGPVSYVISLPRSDLTEILFSFGRIPDIGVNAKDLDCLWQAYTMSP